MPVCPRCGGQLHRRRRRLSHRLLSLVHPVRYFVCSQKCGFRGLLPSRLEQGRRRRQIHAVLVMVTLALGVGLAVWKYRGRLEWAAAKPPPGDGAGDIVDQ